MVQVFLFLRIGFNFVHHLHLTKYIPDILFFFFTYHLHLELWTDVVIKVFRINVQQHLILSRLN